MIVGDSFSCRLAGAWCDVSSPMAKWQTGSGIVCNVTIRGPHGSGGTGNASIFRGFSRVPAFFSNREGYLTLTARSRGLVCSSCRVWSQVYKHHGSNLRWSLWTVRSGWDGPQVPSWNKKKQKKKQPVEVTQRRNNHMAVFRQTQPQRPTCKRQNKQIKTTDTSACKQPAAVPERSLLSWLDHPGTEITHTPHWQLRKATLMLSPLFIQRCFFSTFLQVHWGRPGISTPDKVEGPRGAVGMGTGTKIEL